MRLALSCHCRLRPTSTTPHTCSLPLRTGYFSFRSQSTVSWAVRRVIRSHEIIAGAVREGSFLRSRLVEVRQSSSDYVCSSSICPLPTPDLAKITPSFIVGWHHKRESLADLNSVCAWTTVGKLPSSSATTPKPEGCSSQNYSAARLQLATLPYVQLLHGTTSSRIKQ